MNLLHVGIEHSAAEATAELKDGGLWRVSAHRQAAYVSTRTLASQLAWKHDNMLRSVRAYAAAAAETDKLGMCKSGSGWIFELPVLQRFLHWLVLHALNGKPVLQRMRMQSIAESELGQLAGVAQGAGACVDLYRHKPGYEDGVWSVEKSELEKAMLSWRSANYTGGFTTAVLTELAGVDMPTLRRMTRSMGANDPRVVEPDNTGWVNDYTAMRVLTHQDMPGRVRDLVLEHLWRRSGLQLSHAVLPESWRDVDVHSAETVAHAIRCQDTNIKRLEQELSARDIDEQKQLHSKEVEVVVLRARLAGLETELAQMRAGLASACQAGFYVGEKSGVALSTAELRKKYRLITVSDVAAESFHIFVRGDLTPVHPRLMGDLRPTRANILLRLCGLLDFAVLVKKTKAGDIPYVKPSLAGLAVVHKVKVSDASSACHLMKHGTNMRGVYRVFYSRAILPWFAANGPELIDAWADAGYTTKE